MIPMLSILICSIKSRADLLKRIISVLMPQITHHPKAADIELLIDTDDGDVTIGQKRNRLLEKSSGMYVCFVDDDDTVSPDYVASLMEALDADADCVGFRANWYEDGKKTGDAIYSLDIQKRDEIQVNADGLFRIERFIGHLQPVRRHLAIQTGFAPWNYGEDADYSIRLKPLLSTQKFVDHVLYHYWLRNRDARAHEKVHPQRWQDDNFRVERSLGRAVEIARLRKREPNQNQTVPPDTDR